MWFVQRVDDTNWVVRTRSKSSESFLVTLFSSGDNHQVCMSVVGEDHSDPHVSLVEEVFATTFWDLKPYRFMAEFLSHLLTMDDLENPVELVYTYGGTVKSRSILVPTVGGLH